MNGRIATYIHSDNITQNKHGALIRVKCESDAAAKTDQFIDFCDKIAKYACGCRTDSYKELIDKIPLLEADRFELKKLLKEEVEVDKIIILSIDDVVLI